MRRPEDLHIKRCPGEVRRYIEELEKGLRDIRSALLHNNGPHQLWISEEENALARIEYLIGD